MREDIHADMIEFLRALSLNRDELCRYCAVAQGKFRFEYPDDDQPSWDNETNASRALALAAFRVLHSYTYHAPGSELATELRGILTVLEYMIAANDQQYFWCLDKERDFTQGPLDYGWDLMSYLARNALSRILDGHRGELINYADLVSKACIRLLPTESKGKHS